MKKPASWPTDLRSCLEARHDLFLGWERGGVAAPLYRFFRHWGGEALYSSYESDPITSSAIRVIGTPCIVEADIPIASLGKHGGLAFKIVRRFLKSRGF